MTTSFVIELFVSYTSSTSLGASTVRIRGTVQFEDGLPPLKLEQIYAGDFNAPVVAAIATAAPLSYLANSTLEPVRIKSAAFTISAAEARKVWQIDQVTASRREARPGDDVDIAVIFAGEGVPFTLGSFKDSLFSFSTSNGVPGTQHDPGDRLGRPPLEALVEGRVLAVDGQQEAAAACMRGRRQLTGGDEALLVRERERHAGLERPQRRPHPREADDRVQDDVGPAPLEQLDRITAHLGVLDAVCGGKRGELRRARLERAEPQGWVCRNDLDRLTADRTRGAQEGDTFHIRKDA